MAKLALIWDLGAGLGHISRLVTFATELQRRGHECALIVRDTTRLAEVLGERRIRFLQAPVWMSPPSGLPPAINLCETLFLTGFLDSDRLMSLASAWRHTFDLLRPDALIFDHAPVAILAARGLELPQIQVGTSFTIPPLETPFPPYRYWEQHEDLADRLAETESRCTRTANKVIASFGGPPILAVRDIYATSAAIICERPEFDVYGKRNNATFFGTITGETVGTPPRWPAQRGPKIFAYLKASFAHLEPVLEFLSCLDASVLIYAAGLPAALRNQYENTHMSFTNTPVRLGETAAECDYAICHAGAGTVNVFADAGKPMFLIPQYVEQVMLSYRVVAQGTAACMPAGRGADAIVTGLDEFFANTSLPERVKQWVAGQRSIDMESRLNNACNYIETFV